MKASVVIPSRGGAQRLPLLLSTLAAQTYQDWEAIVVIDGDIDGSAEVVGRYSHLPVRCVVFPENRGRVAALNAGFAAATGEVLIRADDDFELSPGHIAAHVEPHTTGRVGVIGLPHNIAPDNAYMRAYGTQADERARKAAPAMPAQDRWRLWGGNVSCTRAVYDELGGYDDRYVGYGWEDVDFGYRLHCAGIPLVLAEGALVRHHMASVNARVRTGRAYHSGRARATFESIHGTGTTGEAGPPPDGLWNRLVLTTSRWLDEGSLAASARVLDGVLPILPVSVGRKLTALAVEAGAVAGFRRARSEQV